MSYINVNNIILDYDISIDKNCILDYTNKIKEMSYTFFYWNTFTIEICNYFKDRINYCMPTSRFFSIRDGEIKSFYLPLNKWVYNTREEVINHLEDRNKIIYSHKVEVEFHNWNLYIYEIDNRYNVRNNKLDLILG